jgi:hypothetical protein
MISQQGFFENFGIHAIWAPWVLAAAVIMVLGFALRSAPVWRMFAIASVASLIIVPHVYGYDAALLLLPIWLTIFRSKLAVSKVTATMLSTPIPFGMALAGKPYAITASAALLIFFLLLARESYAGERQRVTFGWNP